jgi:ribosomal protein L30/L7E
VVTAVVVPTARQPKQHLLLRLLRLRQLHRQ